MTQKPRSTISSHPARPAISVIETETGCTFRIGTKLLARSVAIFWIMAVDAKRVVDRARKIAGKGAGGNAAISALHQAANDLRATLTPHDLAVSRAGDAAGRIGPKARCENSPARTSGGEWKRRRTGRAS